MINGDFSNLVDRTLARLSLQLLQPRKWSQIALAGFSNHFHLLCEVPEPKTLSEAEVLERIEAGYGLAA